MTPYPSKNSTTFELLNCCPLSIVRVLGIPNLQKNMLQHTIDHIICSGINPTLTRFNHIYLFVRTSEFEDTSVGTSRMLILFFFVNSSKAALFATSSVHAFIFLFTACISTCSNFFINLVTQRKFFCIRGLLLQISHLNALRLALNL